MVSKTSLYENECSKILNKFIELSSNIKLNNENDIGYLYSQLENIECEFNSFFEGLNENDDCYEESEKISDSLEDLILSLEDASLNEAVEILNYLPNFFSNL